MAKQYNLKNIRTLLTEGFSEEELRNLCFDDPAFKQLYYQLPKTAGQTHIVQQLLEYAEQKELIPTLLGQAKKANPAKYEKCFPYELEKESGEIEEIEDLKAEVATQRVELRKAGDAEESSHPSDFTPAHSVPVESTRRTIPSKVRTGIWLLIALIGVVSGLMGNVVANFLGPWFSSKPWLAVGIFLAVSILGLYLEWLLNQTERAPVAQPTTIAEIIRRLGRGWAGLPLVKRVMAGIVPVALVLFIAVGLWYLFRTPEITCPEGKSCVFVASFTPVENDLARQVTQDISRELAGVLGQEHGQKISVLPVPAITEQKEAKELARGKGTLLVVWGEVYPQLEQKVRLYFEFSDKLDLDTTQDVRPFRNQPIFYSNSIEITSQNPVVISGDAGQQAGILSYLLRGIVEYSQGRPEGAAPQLAAALFCAGEMIDKEMLPAIEPVCQPAKPSGDLNPGLIYYYLGRSFLLTGDYQHAIAMLEGAISHNPRDPSARAAVGAAYQNWLLQPDAPEAVEALTKAEQLAMALLSETYADEEERVVYHYELGLIRELANNFSGALQSYQAAIDLLDPGDKRGYAILIALARVQQQLGNADTAEEKLEQARALVPESAWTYLELATIQQDNRDVAQSYLDKAASIAPDEAYVDITWANLCQTWRDYECAAKAYERALDKRPNSGWLQNRIGEFYQPTNPTHPYQNWEQAEQHYREAVNWRPADPWSHERLAYVLHNQEKFAEAAQEYQRTIDLAYLERTPARLYCNLGRVNEKAGKRAEAIEDYQRCVDLSPTTEQREFANKLLHSLKAE